MEKIDTTPLTPYIIYSNLIKMFECRKIKISEQLNSEDEAKKILLGGARSLNVIGKYTDGCSYYGTVAGAVVAEDIDIIGRSLEFKKFIAAFKQFNNIIIVVMTDKNISENNAVARMVAKAKKEFNILNIEIYHYNMFCCDLTKNYIVAKHTIMSKEKVEEFKKYYNVTEHSLAKILETDPQAVWIGLRPGQCVKIDGVSQVTGGDISYRYCI